MSVLKGGHSRKEQLASRLDVQLLDACHHSLHFGKKLAQLLAKVPGGAGRPLKKRLNDMGRRREAWWRDAGGGRMRRAYFLIPMAASTSTASTQRHPIGRYNRSDGEGHWTHSMASALSK
eukprot:scaffold34484_cov63-Phaeocystis_antarctica.AAC.9